MITATPGTAIRVPDGEHPQGLLPGAAATSEELRTAIRAVGRDPVLLQEVHGPREGSLARRPSTFADTLARPRLPQCAGARRAHGNAVLSRWPILRHVNHDITQPGDEPRGLL